jgi:parvulin-like peptidyl-prolyl isomerase
MPFLRSKIVAFLALALALIAAGCGGGEEARTVPAGAIALVGEQEIAKSEFDRVIAEAEKTYKAQKQEFPAAGSPEYEQLKNAIVKSLVEQSEWEQEAATMGIEVSDADIEKRLDELKKQYFDGDEKRYEREIKKQGLTDARIRDEIRTRVLSEKIFESVTSKVTVTDADIQKYYRENKAQFESREIRHILVKDKAKADDIYSQLQAGASFAALAKRFSQDPGSASKGGKLDEAVRARLVKPFADAAFTLETGALSQPVKTDFGWHLIEAVEDVMVTPLDEVRPTIEPTLLREKQNTAMRDWVNDVKKKYANEIVYAPGFAPPRTSTQGSQTSTD